ncbi:phenylacetate-CoA oxygenase/reductase subunit PaaK [Saxibacter everestensis]|uniref:Phenylacetate-CoA oxygenase/reductase subunit PaaK n=1 Tax=Saxibacter everestensis TaxID=2909229 RepID=A0ABY8QQ95_9MICO|nr:phenylacetate-CoA oxygenase/reductase subunit PaaK [Brevibacteriaceae bacterium ZFBP1038]
MNGISFSEPSTVPPARRRHRFFPLVVSGIRELTAEAVEVSFTIPPELAEQFEYIPGQHVALKATVDGQDIRRSYSLCAVPNGRELKIGVKETYGGLFSTFVRSTLKPGDTLEVMNPQGSFTSSATPDSSGRVVALVAGSGITPVMALAESVLQTSAHSRFTLVYANRTAAEVMFLEEIADLKDRFPARFDVHHVLSREGRDAELYSGRIDAPKLEKLLHYIVRPESVDEWFLCGPLELVELSRKTLDAAGVDRARVHFELFSTGDSPARSTPRPVSEKAASGPQRHVTFRLDGRSATVDTPAEDPETILTAALRKRADVPFACAGGVCGTCKAVLVKGTVDMADNFALEPDELKAGYVLTCQSTPTSDDVEVDYDR